MRVSVSGIPDDLKSDCAKIPALFYQQGRRIIREDVADGGKTARRIARFKSGVERNAKKGNGIAQRIARERSGPHGSNYYKRLSAEATGPLTAEYGPHDGGTPVGAGFRHGGVNMDLPNSADIIGPEFADQVGDLAERLFW
jgi:hypothetical protein